MRAGAEMSPEEFGALMERMNMVKMNELRVRVDEFVRDPATAAALKPWYALFCKRPCFHDEFLQAFNEPGVQLVDTDGKGVERITGNSVVVDGVEYRVDCLIYATGFEVGTAFTRRIGYDLTGRDGRSLSAYWADDMRSLHGMHVHGFPKRIHRRGQTRRLHRQLRAPGRGVREAVEVHHRPRPRRRRA